MLDEQALLSFEAEPVPPASLCFQSSYLQADKLVPDEFGAGQEFDCDLDGRQSQCRQTKTKTKTKTLRTSAPPLLSSYDNTYSIAFGFV